MCSFLTILCFEIWNWRDSALDETLFQTVKSNNRTWFFVLQNFFNKEHVLYGDGKAQWISDLEGVRNNLLRILSFYWGGG